MRSFSVVLALICECALCTWISESTRSPFVEMLRVSEMLHVAFLISKTIFCNLLQTAHRDLLVLRECDRYTEVLQHRLSVHLLANPHPFYMG